jgi:hypothetical protein
MTTPVLSCPHCSLVEVPRLTEGSGPHTAKASCSGCGKFLRWVPKQLLQPKETRMVASINRVTLLGTISTYGMEVRYNPTGTPYASFTLVVSEAGQDGKTHDVYVPCEVWGKKAEAASELESGQLILFEGKLRKRQKGEQWELIVAGFEVQPVITSSVVTEATV